MTTGKAHLFSLSGVIVCHVGGNVTCALSFRAYLVKPFIAEFGNISLNEILNNIQGIFKETLNNTK